MRRIIIACIFCFVGLLAAALPAYALADPDDLDILRIKVVRNTVESGDFTILFEYFLDYSTLPTTPPALESFIFRLYAADGTTLLASQSPFVLFNAGYGRGVSSFYFPATTAPAWLGEYVIQISGSPAHFSTLPTPFSVTLGSGHYASSADQDDNQDLAARFVIDASRDINTTYSDVSDLMVSSDSGMVLSSYGEVYYRGAIPGIDQIAPSLFFLQSEVLTPTDMGYSSALGTTYGDRLDGSDLMNGFTRAGAKMGTSGQTLAAFLVIALAILMVIFTAYRGWGPDPGMIAGSIILTAAAVLLGEAVLAIRLVMGLLVAIILFYQFYLKRA